MEHYYNLIGYNNHAVQHDGECVDIQFKTKRLQETCGDRRKRDQEFGPERGKRLGIRLDQMRAAANLEEFKRVHQRAHPLRADRKGQWAADLDGPYRLIFEPISDPAPVTDDRRMERAEDLLALNKILVVKILEVGVDYHG